MFSRGVSPDMPADKLIKADMKEFHLGSRRLAISQVTTVASDQFLARSSEFVSELEAIKKENQYDIVLMMITNVLKEGTELLFAGDPEVIKASFSADDVFNHYVFLPGVLSRKLQVVPALSQLWG